jgi:hypothetical protein
MNAPAISVVMVLCNVERFLPEAIDSILKQSYGDFEFIIVDFGSTDQSKTIALGYAVTDSRIRFHQISTARLPEARNAACRLARGRYIAVMDADDISVPGRLASEIDFMEKHPEVGVVGGATEWIGATGRSLCVDTFPTTDREIRSELANRSPFCQPAVLIRKEAFDLVGGYRPAFLQAEDYDLWTRIAEHYQVANLSPVVLKYRIHPYQISMRKQRQQALCVLAVQRSALARRNGAPDPLDSMKEITPAALVDLGVAEAEQQNVLAAQCRQWIRHMCLANEHAVALEAAMEILQCGWNHVESWQIADLYLTVARLHWEQRRFLKSSVAMGRALATRPTIIGRPFKPLLHRFGLARAFGLAVQEGLVTR